jgi:Tfp pilus assembly PilM family ATPase
MPAHLVSLVEATVPPISSAELRQALPFESRKHLFLEGMESPRLDVQLLGPADSGTEQRALFAAVGLPEREARIAVFRAADIPVVVVDAEPLSLLNALLRRISDDAENALAILDVGASHVGIQITSPAGGFLHRRLGSGLEGITTSLLDFGRGVARSVDETLVYYRGRNRREVKRLHVCGGGALHPEVLEQLRERLAIEVSSFDPLAGFASARVLGELGGSGTRLATASGLCHWWDEPRV